MKTLSFEAEQREFLTLVTRAAFANPFSEERTQLDLKIAGLSDKNGTGNPLDTVLARVHNFLEKIRPEKKGSRGISSEDQRIIRYAHLFDIFHSFADKFDELIQTQIKAGEVSCPAAFAKDTLDTLCNRGFTQMDAMWYFAMFYQLRRAFYFINTLLIGQSPSMKQLRMSLWNNVFTHDMQMYEKYLWNRMEDFSTFLLGETGTGKGTAATAIGRSGFIPFDDKKNCFSESFMRSFTAINLSQFPESLIESELFGHRKGAFTGAVEAHEGIFSRCSPHGAIFLDEIGDVSIPVQIKLLHVLQDRMFSPVGSHEKKRFHGRVIAASNKPIDELRRKELFRNDFFYRLCSDIIIVPPLRQRISEDSSELDELLSITIQKITRQSDPELTAMIRKTMDTNPGRNYTWPGNVRELEQCVRRILLTHNYAGDIKTISHDLQTNITSRIENGSYTAEDLLIDYAKLLYDRFGTYEEVARRSGLDRRTVKKYILQHGEDNYRLRSRNT
ncbi:MAG: sigma 54-interacting transcriptional regulator [Kiritimatiellae bacterium]|nr:sigma 54-interacting transcriptional regulator [Kiritimatiellia bacterium]MDD5522302.1 sigma 54-interacting transcriptional regulator [Kiritimatiellia bacterium]